MTVNSSFFAKRRSVLAKKMSSKEIPNNHVKEILDAGIRVPDHGALNPWKISVIIGDKLKQVDEQIILAEYKRLYPLASEETLKMESTRLQRASVVLQFCQLLLIILKFRNGKWVFRLEQFA